MLSPGEQQRLGIARALLAAPDYLLLDEATSALDDAAEAALYRLMAERLRGTTVISIGHRATLNAFHQRTLVLVPDGEKHRLRESVLQEAAK
jgi:putative ATP-binding cassette transporter